MDSTNSTELRTDGGDRRTSRSSIEQNECLSCGGQLHPDVEFCRHCGVESPFDSVSADEATVSADPTTTETVVTDRDHDEPVDTTGRSESGPSTQRHPVAAVAEELQDSRSFSSDSARELCRLLSDPPSDETQLEQALSAVLEATETQHELEATTESLGNAPRTEQLESTQRELRRIDGALAENITTVVTELQDRKQEATKYESERDEFRDETKRLCREVSRRTDVPLSTDTPLECTRDLADKLRNDALVFRTPGDDIQQIAGSVERSVSSLSPSSQEFLSGLKNADGDEVAEVVRTTAETLDEYDELRTALDNISEQDVRRQLDSLDADLQTEDEPIYRHLADRVRELEAMVDRETVDRIQLYAIYQESRFYDRTLIPRLARSSRSAESVDISQQTRDIESRIDAIRTEYVDVRADHNHTIPNHFLELADSLCSRAQRLDGSQSQQAAGILAAAAELLGHIEQLYERNEYSVMLRRLRG